MRRTNERGQSLVLVALSLTVLLGATAVAIDAGQFFSERRFLQNAADAAALAAATAISQGRNVADAEAAARDTLTRNFAQAPTPTHPPMPSTIPIYAAGHVGEARYLVDGILIQSADVRVALHNRVDYTFGRVMGMVDQEITATARAGYAGGLLPIAVRQYIRAPGPTVGAVSPCTPDENRFMAMFATSDTSCLGSDADASARADPSEGADFSVSSPTNDPSHHGPVVEILGQGASPGNAADFRGFITLDIRDFSTTTSQDYYNGVTSGMNANTLKAFEADWILKGGYPGPGFPAITTPPDPADQVGIMSGNSAGIVVDAMDDRYAPGDEILIAVYPGTVMAIPEFAVSSPGMISLPISGTVASAGSFKVSRNQAFLGTVDLSTLPDSLDPLNPMVLGTLSGGSDPIDYDPDPVSPGLGSGSTVQMRNVTTAGAATGIYALWVKGQAGSPYLTAKMEPLALKVGTVTCDFLLSADATGKVAANVGDAVTFTLLLTNTPNRNTNFGANVTLSVDAPLPSGTGTITFSSTSVAPSKNGTAVTLTINTATLPQGEHRFVVRATGMNGDSTPVPVTHLLPLTVNVAPTGTPGSDQYIDITGFALMRVTSIDSNTVSAYAITPVISDLDDYRLRRGQKARLLPW